MRKATWEGPEASHTAAPGNSLAETSQETQSEPLSKLLQIPDPQRQCEIIMFAVSGCCVGAVHGAIDNYLLISTGECH